MSNGDILTKRDVAELLEKFEMLLARTKKPAAHPVPATPKKSLHPQPPGQSIALAATR